MSRYNVFFLIVSFFTIQLQSQADTIPKQLEKVVVRAKKVVNPKLVGLKSVKIGTNQIQKNPMNLTDLLRFNSPISFRDYGSGGVSTARFRGTSASNTLVLWNGLAINAIGNGQTDFNALSANTLDEIIVKSGGAGVAYGSGAIGGVVELNDLLEYKKQKSIHLFSSYGSFATSSNFLKVNIADKKWAIKLAATYNTSINDYTYIDSRFRGTDGNLFKNENGNYDNYSINFTGGYRFSKTNKLTLYSTKYYGNRLFSAGLPNPSAGSERNEDFNQRNLLKWEILFGKLRQEVNVAYLTQSYRYYNDKNSEDFSFGESENFHFSYNTNYRFSSKIKASLGIVYDNLSGKTDVSNLSTRNTLSTLGSFIYNPNQWLSFHLNGRSEYNSDFKIPESWSFAINKTVSNTINLTANVSRNYRVPTFNELYWPVVGNLNLIPEKSLQGEFGTQIQIKNLSFSGTIFYIHIDDKIVWQPAGSSNLWSPLNIDTAMHKGVEGFLNYKLPFSGNKELNISSNYTYAVAKDLEKDVFLPFAPKHLWNFNIDYQFDKVQVYAQNLYQSKVFTNVINIDVYALSELDFVNLGGRYNFLKTKQKELSLGVHINNLFNTVYYFSNLRPMPGTNFNINLNLKF